MMKKLLNNYSTKFEYSFYCALFRVFIALFLIKDVIITNGLKNLLYKGVEFYIPTKSFLLEILSIDTNFIRNNFDYFNILYLIIIILYLFGVGKKFTAFMLYIIFDIMQQLNSVTLNGGDNLLKFILLYMVFINSYEYFSISKIKYKNPEFKKFDNFISNMGVLSIKLHLCLVYFLSAVHKINADVWFNGVATYYTLSLERFRGTTFNLYIAKNAFIVLISTYMTILIEISYPFLIWFKKTRKILVILAIMLHISISILMMLLDFQVVFILVQGFFFSNKEILLTINKIKNFQKKTKKMSNPIKLKNIFKISGIWIFIIIMLRVMYLLIKNYLL